jgi:hypothetical protein
MRRAHHDELTGEQGRTAEERLGLRQTHSGRVMEGLPHGARRDWKRRKWNRTRDSVSRSPIGGSTGRNLRCSSESQARPWTPTDAREH